MADNHDYHGLFTGLKAIYGPRSNAVVPVKSADGGKLYTELHEIQSRWKEHFCNLLNQQGSAAPDACKWLKGHQSRDDLCYEITMEELEKALKATASHRAPGLDGIPSEVLKKGGRVLREELLKLVCTSGLQGCTDCHNLQEKGRPSRLWKLQGHLLVSHNRQSSG